MFKNVRFLIPFYVLISGCSIHGSMQGLYGYYGKTADEAPGLLRKTTEPVCSLKTSDEPVVIVINGKALQPCLKQYKKALLYIWTPKCSSDRCIPLGTLQAYADKRDWELIIVAEYYDVPTMKTSYDIKRPIFGIDCPYYGSNLTKQYLSRFLEDALGPDNRTETKGNTFFLFEKGMLRAQSLWIRDLPEA